MDNFIKQALTISVAQICENIGWHSITDSSMNIMTDILHHYISDLSITSKKYAEHAYGDVPDIQDIEKAFRQKSVSLNELRRYIKSTGPVKFPHNLPVLNIRGNDVLNALKPGSREIVTRPIHIHEHLPTLCTEPIQEEQSMETEQVQTNIVGIEQEPEVILHKRLREISSVVMTSGGFLSPSREGRLAESKLLPFPEIKKDIPPESSKLSVILPTKIEESSHKITPNKKKIKSKRIKLCLKKKQTRKKPKLSESILRVIEPKPEVLKKIKKSKEDKILISKEPVIDEVIDVVNITEKIEIPKIVVPMPHTNKVKMEEILPKFSFFGPLPLPHSPGLIPPTLPQISNMPEKVEKPTSPIVNVEVNVEKEDIHRKEQKKKKKEKKKEKREKKKQKDKVKEKKKEKLKCGNKVPKLKFRFGARIEPTTKVLSVEKPLEVKNITIVPEPEPMEIDIKIKSESDISVDVLRDINSPPRVPIQKIKTKIITKIVQPTIISPDDETPPPPAFYYDNAGNQVWICPMCTKPDDGSPMIGCDGCDVWYHWVCVGIQCPPDCAVWYCPKCMEKRVQNTKGKRGRPRKSKC